ncbi:hypothetical protein [Halarcobacter sp.]|uniref:hypothetical protein n=1 Tax=Halarcobacter sp. TaxID=2321133 RepID=UPI003A91525C
MKKKYEEILAEKRRLHNLKRKKHKYEPKEFELPEYTKLNSKSKPPKRKTIKSPENFSIIDNTNEVMDFFNDSKHVIEDLKKNINQDFKKISAVTPDAILYMMSYIDDMKNREVSFSINGNFPNDKQCRKLFQESGFLLHLKSELEYLDKIETDILTIRVGTKTEPKVAQDVVKYVRKWLSIDRLETKPIYKILIECMTNTKNHAFKDIKEDEHNNENDNFKWYLMAYHNNGEVHFVFLDNGHGIARTIRRNWKDIFTGKKYNDSKLVLSALEGDILRSQTGEAKRGKGLPYIYTNAKEEHIKELIIITNKGYINCKNDKTKLLEEKFLGTLISWKIRKEYFDE